MTLRTYEQHIGLLLEQSREHSREFQILKGIDFCSNDYLSLKSHSWIKQRFLQFISDEAQLCSTGSRLVSGHSDDIACLEKEFAAYIKRPNALFFANGYQANLSVMASVLFDCVAFSDEGNHASIIDGLKLSGCEKHIYQHCDVNDLEALLQKPSRKARAIVTESVFSANGTRCDVASLIFLANKYNAFLIVDESHATGIIGSNGAGLLSLHDGCSDNIISTHSCGKALASFGAFVACSEEVATIIKNRSRAFICTTAPPPYVIAHVRAIIDLVTNDHSLREQLLSNIINAQGILKTDSAIIPVVINDDDRALFIQQELAHKNLDVAVFRYPSVKRNHAQLRITLHSGNTQREIQSLQHELENLL